VNNLDELLDYRFQELQYQCFLSSISEIIDKYELPRIDFLKIDVQRSELDVLNGIRTDHWPLVQQIAMEVHDEPNVGTHGRLQHICDHLTELGYRVFTEQDGRLSGSDRYNLFATRDHK
jgi:hypothetical protein